MLALMRGIAAAGDELVNLAVSPHSAVDCVAVQWWGDAVRAQALGHLRVLVCELGWLGDRHREWSQLAWDGLNGRGIHGLGPEREPPPLEPWRVRSDGYALILGQVPNDWAVRLALKDRTYSEWLADATELLELCDFEVRYRPHPEVAALDPSHARRPTLLEELEGARLALTLNSTAAVQAVCAGVPTVVMDRRGCMAAGVSASCSGLWLDREPPHRRAWVNRLARMQWSMAELESGEAWITLRSLRGG